MGDARGGSGWERLFRLVFERTANPIALLDEERRIVDVNGAAVALLGSTREHWIGTSFARHAAARTSATPPTMSGATSCAPANTTASAISSRPTATRCGSSSPPGWRKSAGGGSRSTSRSPAGEPEPLAIARGAAELGLTERESEVVTLIAMGLDTGEIAAQLHISPETVRTHVRNAMGKLGVHTRAQLVATVLCGEQTLHVDRVGAA